MSTHSELEVHLKGYLKTVGYHGYIDVIIDSQYSYRVNRYIQDIDMKEAHKFNDVAPGVFSFKAHDFSSLESLDPEVSPYFITLSESVFYLLNLA